MLTKLLIAFGIVASTAGICLDPAAVSPHLPLGLAIFLAAGEKFTTDKQETKQHKQEISSKLTLYEENYNRGRQEILEQLRSLHLRVNELEGNGIGPERAF